MTCIVGLIEGDSVYIGGDSAGVSGSDLRQRKDTKVFRNGDFLIGFTTSFRMGQLLRFKFSPPKYFTEKDVYEYMITDFIESVMECFKNARYAKIENSVEYGGNFLVAFKNRLFSIEGDYQVGENVVPFNACGCGADYAIGSLYTSTGKPKERILKALKTAQEFSAGVREPFIVEEI